MTGCSVVGCEKNGKLVRGWCQVHYRRWERTGNPVQVTRCLPGQSTEDRLRFYGWTVTETGCWEWNGARKSQGYGVLNVNGKTARVHRLAYEAWVGPIPEGLDLRHKCDNPPCMNPDHLEPGTRRQNVQDMVSRKRYNTDNTPRGENHGRAKLTNQDVLDIRMEYATGRITQKALSVIYSVHRDTISRIILGISWSSPTTEC